MSSLSPESAPPQDVEVHPAPQASVSRAVLILSVIIALLVGLGGGYLLGERQGAPAGGGAEAAPSESATSEPATEDLTDEDWEAIWEARRAIPRRDPDDLMAIGELDAPVVMVEFADYRCQYCGSFALETLPQLMPLVEEGTLRIEFRDFPIFGELSIDAAVAARAAAEQGKFLDYHQAIYAYQFLEGGSELTADAFPSIAQAVEMPDLDAFVAALSDQTLIDAVTADYEEASAMLQASTPQFIINDEYVGGAPPAETFLSVIDAELAKVRARG